MVLLVALPFVPVDVVELLFFDSMAEYLHRVGNFLVETVFAGDRVEHLVQFLFVLWLLLCAFVEGDIADSDIGALFAFILVKFIHLEVVTQPSLFFKVGVALVDKGDVAEVLDKHRATVRLPAEPLGVES